MCYAKGWRKMACYIIEGGNRLNGEITVQGSKNGSLPLLSACVLVQGETVLKNCPRLTDVDAAANILTYLGCKAKRCGDSVIVNSTGASRCDIPDSLMQEMRSSVVFLGALLGSFGRAELSSPGGCEIGLRPIDLHLEAMRALGTKITEEGGRLICSCPDGLKGTRITLSFPSVGATENVLLAACTAKGETVLINAAREPEIKELADFLNACGAKIKGAGESIITVEGVKTLCGAEYTVSRDRIAACTFMAAAAVTKGDVLLCGMTQDILMPVLEPFEKTGCKLVQDTRGLRIKAPERLLSFSSVRTMPYPGFPTDSQADFGVMASVAHGTGVIIENIFENRFKYTAELTRMGADIRTEGRVAIIQGVKALHGAQVFSPDLRGGSALVVAGLCAKGVTRVNGIHYIDRGYENFDGQLAALGAKIIRGE